MDEALDVLLGSACHALEMHVRLMLGEEWIQDTVPNDSRWLRRGASRNRFGDRLKAESTGRAEWPRPGF
ncbi:MAG: hypothetical protein AAGJ56_09010 [Myxococcota bacterium]